MATAVDYKQFKDKIEKDQLIPLLITNSIVEYGSTTYPIRNISHIKLVEKEVTEDAEISATAKWLFIIGVIGLLFFGLGIILIIGALYMVGTEKGIIHTFYGLSLETNSGSSNLVFSEDKPFILKIKELITKAMSTNETVNYEIHIGDKNFIDNSITNNHTQFEIKVDHHHGLSEADKEFISVDFKKSIEDLNNELIKIKDTDKSQEKLSEIVKEINSDRPNPGIINKLWESFKTITEGYDRLKTASEAGAGIAIVASYFIPLA